MIRHFLPVSNFHRLSLASLCWRTKRPVVTVSILLIAHTMKNTAVLLLSIPIPLACKGVVAAISQFLVAHNGGVLHADDRVDLARDFFLSRLEWDLNGFDIPISDFEEHFKPVAERFMINYHLALTDYRPKVVILKIS